MSLRSAVLVIAVAVSGCSSPSAPACTNCDGRRPVIERRLAITKILAFGDSMVEGEADGSTLAWRSLTALHNPATPGVARSFPFKLQRMLDERYPTQELLVFNGGFGGEALIDAQTMPRLAALLDTFHPDLVIFLDGANDILAGRGITISIPAMAALVDRAKAANAAVMIATLPLKDPTKKRGAFAELVEPFNAALRTLATEKHALLADVHAKITFAHLGADGLHLNETGNEVVAQVMLDTLRASYETVIR